MLNNNYEKIIIGGFSGGSNMTLYIAYELEQKVGGVISIGTGMMPFTKYNKEKDFPMIFIHGTGKISCYNITRG